MISLQEYLLFEDETKFVKIDYKTTTDTEEKDDVTISGPLITNLHDQEGDEDTTPVEGGVDTALVGEIRLYSETSTVFNERKRKIVEKFKSILNSDEVNANRIKCTKIFEYYITHLIKEYKKDVDENLKLSISSKNELIRQLSDDFVLLIRGKNVLDTV